jgi:hypothetical protein
MPALQWYSKLTMRMQARMRIAAGLESRPEREVKLKSPISSSPTLGSLLRAMRIIHRTQVYFCFV